MCEFIIPARNEAEHVGRIVGSMRDRLGTSVRIIVVDNGSTDDTAIVAWAAGADCVINEPKRGKGNAVVAGATIATNERIFVCDADIVGMDWDLAVRMASWPSDQNPVLTRAHLNRVPETAPVTTLLAGPMIRALGYEGIYEPLGGIFSVERSILLENHLPGDWGFDIALTLLCLSLDISIVEVPVTGVTHRARQLSDYSEMAQEVALAIARHVGIAKWDHRGCTLGCRKAALE